MKIAVLSDIHGNYRAFEQCVKYALARQIHTFIFLGDYAGELAYPQRTMELIYSLASNYRCYFIKGNKEDYWINYRANGEKGWKDKDSTTGALLYTYSNLTEKDIGFFQRLSYKENVIMDGMPLITICHGSPQKVNDKMVPNNEATYEMMEQNGPEIILCGHTHVQRKIEYHGKVVLNPGSVGVPLQSGGKTQFMILHNQNNHWVDEFISLDYDVEQTIIDLHESGLYESAPCWSKVTDYTLRTGKLSHGNVLSQAMKYCREETGLCNWPDIPEQYWERAVAEMLD